MPKSLLISEDYLRRRIVALRQTMFMYNEKLRSPKFSNNMKQRFQKNKIRANGRIREVRKLISLMSEQKKTFVWAV